MAIYVRQSLLPHLVVQAVCVAVPQLVDRVQAEGPLGAGGVSWWGTSWWGTDQCVPHLCHSATPGHVCHVKERKKERKKWRTSLSPKAMGPRAAANSSAGRGPCSRTSHPGYVPVGRLLEPSPTSPLGGSNLGSLRLDWQHLANRLPCPHHPDSDRAFPHPRGHPHPILELAA